MFHLDGNQVLKVKQVFSRIPAPRISVLILTHLLLYRSVSQSSMSHSLSLNVSQTVVMDAISELDLSLPGSPSLVMRDLSEYATLPFLAAFDVKSVPPKSPPGSPVKASTMPQKRITYIGLVKKTMPLLVDLFLRFKHSLDIYVDGTVEAVLSVSCMPTPL